MKQEIWIFQLLVTLNQSNPAFIPVSVKRRPKTWQWMSKMLPLFVAIPIFMRTGQKQRLTTCTFFGDFSFLKSVPLTLTCE